MMRSDTIDKKENGQLRFTPNDNKEMRKLIFADIHYMVSYLF